MPKQKKAKQTKNKALNYILVERLDPNEETETPYSTRQPKLLTPLRLEGENLKRIRKQLKKHK